MNPQLNEVPDLLLENSRAQWDSSHGVYADLSDLSRPKFYSKCPKCKHVHGFYTSLGDAVLKKICGACHFDNIEKLKRDLEKGDKPQKLKPGQKRKLPWPASVVKEAEEIDWTPDPEDPDASTASAAKLKDVELELERAGFAHEYTSHMGTGPRRSRWVMRANDAHSYTAEVEGKEWTLKHYIQERRGWPLRMTGSWKFDEARLISEISKIKSLFPPDVPESAEAVVSSLLESPESPEGPEDIDWSPDPEDPDASTAMPLSCRLESSFDGDTMWFSLRVSNGKTYNCWSVDEAVQKAREHGFIWVDGEPENNLVRKTLGYLGGLPESKEEEIDWAPDPEDPDANTAAAAKLPTDPEGALTAAGYTLIERSDIYFWWIKKEQVEEDGSVADKRKSVYVYPNGFKHLVYGLSSSSARIEGPVCMGSIDFYVIDGGAWPQPVATLRGKYRATIEEALDDIEHFDKTMGLVHGRWRLMNSGRVAEATEEIDWAPDPEDPDASTSATNQPLYWEVKLTFNFPSGPTTFWCDEGGPAASHTRLPYAIAKRVASKITSKYSPTSSGWTITSDQDPQAKLKADYKALVSTMHVEMFPSENQSQMHWQGRLWPQDFWPFEPVQETEDIDWSPDPDDPDASTSAAKYGKLEMLLKANGYESHHDGARLYYEKGKRGKRYVRVTFDSEYSDNPVEVRFAGKSMEVPAMSNNKVWLYLTSGKEVILDQWLLEDAAYYLLHTFMYWKKSGKRPLRRESAERVACALLEDEDIDWSPDPEDPDASTAAVSKIPEPGIEIYNHHKYKVLTVTARQAAYLVANSYASEVSKSAYNAAGLPSDALFIHPLSDKTDVLIALRKAGLIHRTPNNRLPESEDIDWSHDPEDPDASQEHAYIARNQDPSELIRHALRDKLVEKGWRNIRVRQMDEPEYEGGRYYSLTAGVVDDLHRGEWLAIGARVIPQPSTEHGREMRNLFATSLRAALFNIGAKTADELFVRIKPAYYSFDTQQQFDDFEDDHGDWNLEATFHLTPGPKFWGKVSAAQGYEPPVPKTKEDRLAALKAEQEKRARYARTDNPVGADRARAEHNAATKPEIDLSQLPPRDQWDGDTVHRFLTGESIVEALLGGEEDIDWSEDPEDPDASMALAQRVNPDDSVVLNQAGFKVVKKTLRNSHTYYNRYKRGIVYRSDTIVRDNLRGGWYGETLRRTSNNDVDGSQQEFFRSNHPYDCSREAQNRSQLFDPVKEGDVGHCSHLFATAKEAIAWVDSMWAGVTESEDIDWSPDPEDPDASTSAAKDMTELQAGLTVLGFQRQPDESYTFDARNRARYVVRQKGENIYLYLFFDAGTAAQRNAWTRRFADAENLLAYLKFDHAEIFETVTHSPDEIAKEAEKAEEPKSEEHAEAGNYAKGHVKIQGLDLTIENAKGSTRSGEDKDGKPWSVTMPAHYGYVAKVGGEAAPRGKDKDHIDVYIGDKPSGLMVYIVNQGKLDSDAFDEHKCMLGFESKDEATAVYDRAFSGDLGHKLRHSVVSVTFDKFKEWLKSGDTKKPFESVSEAASFGIVQRLLDSEEEIDWSPDPDDPDASTSKHAIDFEPLLERNGFVRDTTTTSRRWAKSYRVDYPESAVGFEGTGVDEIQMCVAWGLDRPSRVVCAAQVWGDGQYRQSALANIYQDDNAGVVWFIQNADAQVAAATKATTTKKGFDIWKVLQSVCSRMARDERHARDEETWRRLDPKAPGANRVRRVGEAEDIDWSEDPEDPDSTTKAHTIDPALSLSSRGYRPLEADSGLTAVERGSNGKRPMFKSYPVDYPQTEYLPADEIRVIITPSDGTSALVGVGLYGRGQLLSIGGMLAWAYTQHIKGDWERILAVADKADECVQKAFSLNVRPRDYAGTATGLWTALEDAFRAEMRQFDQTRSAHVSNRSN